MLASLYSNLENCQQYLTRLENTKSILTEALNSSTPAGNLKNYFSVDEGPIDSNYSKQVKVDIQNVLNDFNCTINSVDGRISQLKNEIKAEEERIRREEEERRRREEEERAAAAAADASKK